MPERIEPLPPLPYICMNCRTQQDDFGPECGNCHKPMVVVNAAYLDHVRERKIDSQLPVKEV